MCLLNPVACVLLDLWGYIGPRSEFAAMDLLSHIQIRPRSLVLESTVKTYGIYE